MIFCIIFERNITRVNWSESYIRKSKEILTDLLKKFLGLLKLLPRYSYYGT